MSFFHQIRSMRTWPRALLVAIVLAFGLSVVAHAAHQHEPAKAGSSLHSVACGYCVSFGTLAATPDHTTYRASVDADHYDLPRVAFAAPSYRPRSSAQPRAPPLS